MNIKKLIAQATSELSKENETKALSRIKAKLTQLENAKQIVINVERELQDLYLQINDGN